MIYRNIMLTVYAKKWWFIILMGLIAGSACSPSKSKMEMIPYRTGSWQPDTLGNHRVVLHVTGNEKAVKAEIPWRRRDQYPGDKMMILVDEKTGQMEIDGLYIDDVAFDRTTMKRVRKTLDRNRDGALIDLHSANQFNVRDGFINSACLYMEHFPYIDRLWFGEYFDKDSPPDFWLIEMSGIPFGLMGEMLQDGGNKYRGMVYGMTSRLPWAGDPRSLWKIWDEFGMEESEMIGYWSPDCPISTDKPTVLATAYVTEDGCLVAIGSWAESTENIHLLVDWHRLGINMENARVEAPYIKDFQEYQSFSPSELIPLEPGKGWILKIYEEE